LNLALGESVNFSGTASDPELGVLRYEWDFNGVGLLTNLREKMAQCASLGLKNLPVDHVIVVLAVKWWPIKPLIQMILRQSCHQQKTPRLAENVNTLYCNSLDGYANLGCELCHGSPHAIWPNRNLGANDNITATQL